MNPSQQRAWADRARYLVAVDRGANSTSVAAQASVAWPTVFARVAPLVVEIGPGTGDSLVTMAAARPDHDHVGFEVFRPAMASTMIKLNQAGLSNVRLVEADGAAGLRWLFPPASLEEVWTFFPDPWHKVRHHKRRLISAEFASLVACRLRPDGVWRIATDWPGYAEHCREVLDEHPDLENLHHGWAPRLAERPITKYERRGLEAGRTVRDLSYRRRR